MILKTQKMQDRIARARTCLGKKCAYKLGHGGFNPSAKYPWDAEGLVDCSGGQAWVAGMRRDQVNAKKPWSKVFPWFETSAIEHDATHERHVFQQILHPVPGCWVVAGDHDGHQGHIGLVTEVIGGQPWVLDFAAHPECVSEGPDRYDWFKRHGGIFVVLNEDVVPE